MSEPNGRPGGPDVLRLHEVSVEFSGVLALREVSLSIRAGEWLGVIGPNGSGKTTLMNIIMGVYAISHGEMFYTERDISKASALSSARAGMFRSFQHDQLSPSLTLAENVALGIDDGLSPLRPGYWFGRERRLLAQARDVLASVGCAEFADLLPAEAPQGMRRLAGIARALCSDHGSLLLFDEPAAGLSPGERDRLRLVLEDMRKSRPDLAVMLIEHDVSFVADESSRVIALDAGVKIADGPTFDVLHSQAVASAFLGK
jgi:ABC-type branched-subunit amino acid transport system ATPase component